MQNPIGVVFGAVISCGEEAFHEKAMLLHLVGNLTFQPVKSFLKSLALDHSSKRLHDPCHGRMLRIFTFTQLGDVPAR